MKQPLEPSRSVLCEVGDPGALKTLEHRDPRLLALFIGSVLDSRNFGERVAERSADPDRNAFGDRSSNAARDLRDEIGAIVWHSRA